MQMHSGRSSLSQGFVRGLNHAAIVLCVSLAMSLSMAGMVAAQGLEGVVTLGGVSKEAAVTLFRTQGPDAPAKIAETSTKADGSFTFDSIGKGEGSLYALAELKGAKGLSLLSVIGPKPASRVVVNELTTIASVFTHVRFMDKGAIKGNPLGLAIAAGNVPNLVDPATGAWGKVLTDPINSTENATLARLNTLAALLTAFPGASDDWRKSLLEAMRPVEGAAPGTALEALVNLARRPWGAPGQVFAAFDEAFPQPADGSRRKAPFAPYLAYAPKDFAMILHFAGGGAYSPGRLKIDAKGNVWSGQNWLPGSQSGVLHWIGGGTVKLAPDGTPLSPAISGFTGMEIDGIGWGTGVSEEAVWVADFEGHIGVMDFSGKPLLKKGDLPFDKPLKGLQGIHTARNGDVWIAGAVDNNLIYFPSGKLSDGKIVEVKGLSSPFSIVVDDKDRVWVTNALADSVIRFPTDDPTKTETFTVGLANRGSALDSKGNLWVASNLSPDFPLPTIPPGVPILKQFQIAGTFIESTMPPGGRTGIVSMITPEGTKPNPAGYDGGGAINVPWGLSIDGNDDVWVGNFWGRGVVLLAGDDTGGHPGGTKPGDLVHYFESGSIQMVTDVTVDPAGTVWVANNWNDIDAVLNTDPDPSKSTWGGGSGIVAIYGVAAPVQTPLLGTVRSAVQ